MKRHAATVLFLVLAVGLGVFVWLDRDKVTEGEKRRREDNVFSAWRRDELARVTLQTDETLTLQRDAKGDATWRMTSPRAERADLQAVERLLTTLEFATIQRRASEGSLGFDAPRASGSIQMGGLTYRFVLGAPSPRPEGSSYFRVDDGPPIVVSRELTTTLLAGADTYRDRTVVPYLSIELDRFTVERAGGKEGFALVHDQENDFRVASEGVLASREALDKVWSALAGMRAEVFPRDAEAAPAADTVTLRMVPRDRAKPEAVLVVGGPCPGHPDDVLVRREAPTKLVACAPRGSLDALRLDPPALVLKKPFTLRADEVEELVLEHLGGGDAGALGPARIELARKGGTFHLRAPDDRDLAEEEADAASELLSRILQTTEASAVRRDGAVTPVHRARIFAGEREEVVELASLDDEPVKAVRKRDGALLELSRASARRLVPRATSLRPRRIMPGETRRPVRVELRCGIPQTLVDEGKGFRLTAPAPGFDADGSVVGLVEALSKGHVDTWVADADDGRFGLDPNGCHAAVVFEEGKEARTVILGAEGEGGIYGTVTGDGAVFVAPLALREMLQAIYVSRTSVRPPPDEVVSVLVSGDRARPRELTGDAAKEAVTGLFADKVLALGRDAAVRSPDALRIVMKHKAGTTKLVCGAGPSSGDAGAPAARRTCAVEGLAALFAVDERRLAPFLARPEVAEAGVPR